MITRKNAEVSLKVKYSKVIRISLILALVLNITVIYSVPRQKAEKTEIEQPDVKIENVDIPETQQYEKPPAPSRPSVPVASESEDIAEDVTIEETTFEEFEALEAPPPPPEGPKVKFVAYDEPPQMAGGMAALRRHLKYPEIAQEAGIEGTVIVQAFINKNGDVEEVVIVKGIPKTGLNEAAINAVKKTKWKPAQQRDRAVGVWYSIPIVFRLKNAD
ncbi:MAG: TonB family protein [Candidatus Marinimicrobia bacterium]|nr:TonB family protein [Candidatus Neomarinimicrobiota bacterium]MCF7827997.1 TonB family protein [Candidatus Neomarinimicrobiota bacterium]MCF7879248.1 TonB family protein [Candidatus Neomarinimicrobiota bacterium]